MSLAQKIRDHVAQLPDGAVFSSRDLPVSGTGSTIDVILHRLSLDGMVRKLGYGLFDKPMKSDLLGVLDPDLKDIISAYARKLSQSFVLDPLNSANLLGFTTQVPAKLVYLTNGKTHKISVLGVDVYFVHKSPKTLLGSNTKAGMLLQALRYSDNIQDDSIKRIARFLTKDDLDTLQSLKSHTYRKVAYYINRINEIATIH